MSATAQTPDTRPIAEDFSVAAQLLPGQMQAVADAGFKSVICNRPDGEAPADPQFDAIRQAAEQAGLAVRYIPVSHQTGITPDNVQDTKAALAELDGPILAYCRSGARSANLYGIAAG